MIIIFGFVDLYDVAYQGNGVSNWSLMGLGCWGSIQGQPQGTMPTAIDAFHLHGGAYYVEDGYISPQLVAPQSLTAGTNTLTNPISYVKLETTDPKQFFLLQPRGNVGYDRGVFHVPSPSIPHGLLVLLVDDNLSSNSTFAH